MRRKLQDNVKHVRQRIEDACARAHRSPQSVTLVGVTKTVALDVIRQLVDLGLRDLGESRPQELARRAAATWEWLNRARDHRFEAEAIAPRWHLIGHLQRNKVRTILPWVTLIHSIDTLRLAEEIDNQSRQAERVTPVLLEVNVSGEAQKHGVATPAALHLAEMLTSLKNLRLCGLMVMAPLTDDVSVIRRVFERARELFDEARGAGIGGKAFTELSMGMSQDFEHAIEFGATMVRIGGALLEGIDQVPEPEESEEAGARTSGR